MQDVNEETSEPQTVDEQLTEQMIALRAYEKWQQRGCPFGEHEQDWFAARAELEQEITIRMQRRRFRQR